MKNNLLNFILNCIKGSACLFLIFLWGCAADPSLSTTATSSSVSTLSLQNQTSSALIGAQVTFNYKDYYSLTSPNSSTYCAGDAKSYYDPVDSSRLPANVSDTSTTIRPSF